jgi:predicted peroxiredoxin
MNRTNTSLCSYLLAVPCAAVLAVLLSGCGVDVSMETGETPTAVPALRDGVFVHISHGTDDLHRVAMGLQMAVLMAADRDVCVYFDIRGVEVVLEDAPDMAFSHFPGSHAQIAKLLDAGATVCVCPGCLKAAGKTADDVMDGVEIADKDRFFGFTQGRILTLDY